MSKVEPEVAAAEFERWADVFEIDISTSDLDPE